MADLLIRKDTWDALTADQLDTLRTLTSPPTLGDPAFGTLEGVEFVRFNDGRITVEQVALVAALVANSEAMPEPSKDEDPEAAMGEKYTPPPEPKENEDRMTASADANSEKEDPKVRAYSSEPAEWTTSSA